MKSLLQTRFDKSSVNFISRIGMAAGPMLIASAPAGVAQIYNFTFISSGGMDATGTIDIVGGVAQIGSINVTGVPVESNPSMLITASAPLLPASGVENVENHNGDVVTYDNVVNFANDPILTGNGLGFGAGQYDATHYNTLIGLNGGDIYGNLSPGLYTLFVGEALLDGSGNVLVPEYVYNYNSGTLALTPSPEPSTVALMLGALAVGAVAIRRRRATA